MTRYAGEDFIVEIEVTPGMADYAEVLSVTEASSNNAVAMTDVTSKGDSGNRTGEAFGLKTTDVTFSGVVDDHARTVQLLDAEGTILNLRLTSGEGTTYTGAFHIAVERSGAQVDAETYSGTLTSAGTIVRG